MNKFIYFTVEHGKPVPVGRKITMCTDVPDSIGKSGKYDMYTTYVEVPDELADDKYVILDAPANAGMLFENVAPVRYEKPIKDMCFMDDVLLTHAFKDNIPAVECILRIIMEKEDLKVESVEVQPVYTSLSNRSVRLDIKAVDSKDNYYDIEFQNDSGGAPITRLRYNLGLMDSQYLKKGTRDFNLPQTYIIFITKDDKIFNESLPIYHLSMFVEETMKKADARMQFIYVNGAMRKANTPLGHLVNDLFEKEPTGMHYPVLRETMAAIKIKEEMIMDKYDAFYQNDIDNAYADGEEKGRADGEEKTFRLINDVWDAFQEGHTPEEIAVKLGTDISRVKCILRLP